MMKLLKNLPSQNPESITSLIECEPNQVVSMALSNSDHVDISLFTFADGEIVSEESYLGDTFYLLLKGETNISIDGKDVSLKAGDIFAVAAHKGHSIGGGKAFKMLQLTLND